MCSGNGTGHWITTPRSRPPIRPVARQNSNCTSKVILKSVSLSEMG